MCMYVCENYSLKGESNITAEYECLKLLVNNFLTVWYGDIIVSFVQSVFWCVNYFLTSCFDINLSIVISDSKLLLICSVFIS